MTLSSKHVQNSYKLVFFAYYLSLVPWIFLHFLARRARVAAVSWEQNLLGELLLDSIFVGEHD